MEQMEDLLKGLKLSEAERRGVKLGWVDKGKEKKQDAMALGTLISEKPAIVDAVARSVGRVWCPMKGVQCKEMGDTIFMFTFLHPGGKKKALDDGPWMFNKELLVMEDYVPSKTLQEYAFSHVPIWVRVENIPMGQ